MRFEHIQKEKEYGIPWRSAYKVELYRIAGEIFQRTMGEDKDEEMD